MKNQDIRICHVRLIIELPCRSSAHPDDYRQDFSFLEIVFHKCETFRPKAGSAVRAAYSSPAGRNDQNSKSELCRALSPILPVQLQCAFGIPSPLQPGSDSVSHFHSDSVSQACSKQVSVIWACTPALLQVRAVKSLSDNPIFLVESL